MAIYGIGIDLVQVERIDRSLARWGRRFTDRVFTEAEQFHCESGKRAAQCYALRFAAKEAFAKALGLGIRKPVLWKDMEVTHGPAGQPKITLSERAKAYCRERGIGSWHLSLTDDGRYGAAVAILETTDRRR